MLLLFSSIRFVENLRKTFINFSYDTHEIVTVREITSSSYFI